MSKELYAIIGAVLGALIPAYFSYKGQKAVADSPAEEMYTKEIREIIEDYKAQKAELQKEKAELQKLIDEVKKANSDLQKENADLKEEKRQLKQQLAQMKEEVRLLREQVDLLKKGGKT